MNVQTLWGQSRIAAPYFRASVEQNLLWKKIVSLFEPCRIPVPVPVTVPVRRPRMAAGLALALLAVSATAAMAQAWDIEPNHRVRPGANWDWNADGQIVDVSVQVDGSAAPLYFKPGVRDRQYFQAFKGRNYSIVVRNTTGRRVGVLLAVDGLNVVNGERTRMGAREAMYVLDPYETATIRGWRTSLSEVRRFVFVDEERSYAERTGQANGDMGWIRVNAFREHQPLAMLFDPRQRANEKEAPRTETAPAPEARRDAAGKAGAQELNGQRSLDESNPGTGWGERRHDPVQRTEFVAERNPVDRITLRYEYESGLRALGITPAKFRNRTHDRERGDLGFAQPPRW